MFQQLEFTTTSIHNTVISDEADKFYYEVLTPEWQPHLTTVKKLDPTTRRYVPVAELQNSGDNKCRPISIKLSGAPLISVDEFLQPQPDEGGKSWRFHGKDGHDYVWLVKGDHLELIRKDSPNTPLAIHHRQKRYLYILPISQNPTLDVDLSVADIMDTVILSFLIAERHRRDSAGLLGG